MDYKLDVFVLRLIEYLDYCSSRFGSGDVTLDLIVVAGILGVLLVLLERDEGFDSSEEATKVSVTNSPAVATENNLLYLTKKQDLNQRLAKTNRGILNRLKQVFTGSELQLAELEDLEMALLASDVGPVVTENLIAVIKAELKDNLQGISLERLKAVLQQKITEVLTAPQVTNVIVDGPRVIMIVGVNGAGKTTTVGKLAQRFKTEGQSVLLVAADTFRAAAVEQLQQWATKVGVEVVAGTEASKPSGVVYDAMQRAKELQPDVVLVDTAGRLHTKKNLMQELGGVKATISKQLPSAPHEVWLVLDGTSGQNGLMQAREFNEVCPLTGLIVTKLDSTSKGGIVVAVSSELGVPVRFIGVGEGLADLKPFVAQEFAQALFAETNEASEQLSEHARVRRIKRTS